MICELIISLFIGFILGVITNIKYYKSKFKNKLSRIDEFKKFKKELDLMKYHEFDSNPDMPIIGPDF